MKHNRTLIVPCAGAGTRMGSLGELYPKCLLPYKDKPILLDMLERMEPYADVCYVGGPTSIQEHPLWKIVVGKSPVPIVFVDVSKSDSPLQTVSGIWESASSEKDNEVILMFSDAIYDFDFSHINSNQRDLVYCVQPKDWSRWTWIVDSQGFPNHYQHIEKPSSNEVLEEQEYAGAWTGFAVFRSATLFGQGLRSMEDLAAPSIGDFVMGATLGMLNPIDEQLKNFVDLGTLESFKENRGLAKARAFNSITIHPQHVEKRSEDYEKIFREAIWMKHSQDAFASRAPSVIDFNTEGWLKMSRVNGDNLRNKMLYETCAYEPWSPIIDDLIGLFDVMKSSLRPGSAFWRGFIAKNEGRAKQLSWNYKAQRVLRLLNTHIEKRHFFNQTSYYHGDPNLSNLFWENGQIRWIDPRGEIWGHWMHDVAKSCMSLFHRYDHIDAELYIEGEKGVVFYDIGYEGLKEHFREKLKSTITEQEYRDIMLIEATLFLSSVPLHYHSPRNQRLYIERGYEVAKQYDPTIL